MSEEKRPVINLEGLPTFRFGNDDGFAGTHSRVGPLIGMEKLGITVTTVPPGKAAFPFHVHHTAEEAFFILEGEGEYRFGADVHPVRPGDLVAAPPGGPERAHQLRNTGNRDLKYLAISTIAESDVVEYPDSGKFAALSRIDWSNLGAGGIFFVGRAETSIDYWDGEK